MKQHKSRKERRKNKNNKYNFSFSVNYANELYVNMFCVIYEASDAKKNVCIRFHVGV